MPNTGEPYFLRFPDGDMPPDGPTQIGELASDVARVLHNVEKKVDSHLQDTTNFRASNYQWNTNQDNAITKLNSDVTAVQKNLDNFIALSQALRTVTVKFDVNVNAPGGAVYKGSEWDRKITINGNPAPYNLDNGFVVTYGGNGRGGKMTARITGGTQTTFDVHYVCTEQFNTPASGVQDIALATATFLHPWSVTTGVTGTT